MKTVLLYTFSLCLLINIQGKVIRVDQKNSTGGDGSSWSSAFKHLQDSLAASIVGDEIWVSEGTYLPDEGANQTKGDRQASFALVNGVRLYGGFKGTEVTRNPLGDANQTILSGRIDDNKTAWSYHVVTGENLDSSTVLSGFRITKGNANGNGIDGMGGGLLLDESSPKIIHCFFTENSSSFYGGAIYSLDSSPTIKNCLFARNFAPYQGGGAYFSKGQQQNSYTTYPSLANCVFSKNSSVRGGAMYNNNSSPIITNCIFSGNTSVHSGGGIYGNGSSPTITNCTFTGNSADSAGGAIYTSTSSAATIQNSILFNNASGNEIGHGISGGWSNGARTQLVINEDNPGEAIYETVSGTNNLIQGKDKGTVDEIDADPLFADLENPAGPDGKWFTADDGLQLETNSSAINAGSNNHIPNDVVDLDKDGNKTEPLPVDIADFKRVQGGVIDLGPYEHGGEMATPPPTVTINVTSLPSTGGTALGGGAFALAETILLTATPSPGYLFSNWSGDATGTTISLDITLTGGMDIVANFVMDENDVDGDGLSNYLEQAIHGTKIDDNDTDDDGLLDNVEIQIETDPTSPNTSLLEFINTKVTDSESNARHVALAEGQALGIAAVKARPSDYALYHAPTDLNASVAAALAEGKTLGKTEGIALVQATPSKFDLYTSAELSASVSNARQEARRLALEEGELSGISKVIDNPRGYDLITELDSNKSLVEARNAGVNAVKSAPLEYGLASLEILEATGAAPHTNGWYYQPQWGWLWTNPKTFPYIFLSSTGEMKSGWLYFRERSSSPAYFYSFPEEKWLTSGQ